MATTAPILTLHTGKTTQPLNAGQPNTWKVQAGEHYRIVKGNPGKNDPGKGKTDEEALLDDVIAKRHGNDLHLQYADGTQVTLKNFYVHCQDEACLIILPSEEAGGYAIDGDSATGVALGDNAALVYAHGHQDVLLGMAQGNAAMHTTLAGLDGNQITYIPGDDSPNLLLGGLLLLGGGIGIAAVGGSGGSGGNNGGGTVEPNIVNVAVVAGPVLAGNGLTVNLYQGDGITLLGSGPISADGTISIDVGSYTGAVIAKLVDADDGVDYLDEASGQPRDITAQLMAVGVAITGTVTLNINPLTTVAAVKAGAVFDGASTAVITVDVVIQSNAAVAAAFGLPDLTGTVIVTTVDATGGANVDYTPEELSAGEHYGAILAALSGMDAANGGDTQTTIDELTEALTISGDTGTLSTTAMDALMVGARTAAATTSGTANTSLTAVVSDLLVRPSAAVSIDPIAIDNVVSGSEQTTTITGTTVAGATVNLSIGGTDRVANVSGTTWSYTLTPDDINAMEEGGETLVATATQSDGSTADTTRSIVVDLVAPMLTITSNVSTLAAGETATITFTFGEDPGASFVESDVVTTGGTLSDFSVTADPLVYTATFTPTAGLASGTAGITVADGTYTDAAGNSGRAGTAPSINIDTLAPGVTITDNEAGTGNLAGGGITYTFTFEEAVTGFTAEDITVANGTKGAFTAVSGTVYTLVVTPTAGFTGNVTVDVAAGVAFDANSNPNAIATPSVQAVDMSAPDAPTISAVATDDIINAAEVGSVISGSNAAGATVALIIGDNTWAAIVNGTSWSYTLIAADITAMGQGAATLRVTQTDAAGNTSAAATRNISVDTAAPTVTITDDEAGTGNIADGDTTFTFTFDEAVTGFTADDITVGNGTKGAFTPSAVEGEVGKVYSQVVTPTAGFEGNVTVDVAAGVAIDANRNPNAIATQSVQAVDMLAPGVTITDDEADTGNIAGGDITYTFTFDEAVTGFEIGDITVGNGTKGAFTPSAVEGEVGTVYSLVVTPTAGFEGNVTVDVAAGVAIDANRNPNTIATQSVQPVDMLAPNAPTINAVATDDIISAAEAGSVISGSNEAGATVALSLGGNTRAAIVNGTSWSYTLVAADITAMGQGAETLSVTQTDVAGNTSAATTRDISVDTALSIDIVAPTVTITDDEAGTGNIAGGDITYTVAFDEAVTGFTADDISVANGTKGTFTAVSGTVYTLVVTPTAGFEGNITVDVAAAGATDAAGNDNTAATQSVQAVDMLAPTLSSSTPADNATIVAVGSNIVLTFSENVAAGTGNIVISNGAGDTRTIAVGDATQVTISGNTVTINPTANLLTGSNYNVQMAAGVLRDAAGNAYAGITDATANLF